MKKLPPVLKDFHAELGWTAGNLWKYLGEHQAQGWVPMKQIRDVADIILTEKMKKMCIHLTSEDYIEMAVGWLTCEGKIGMARYPDDEVNYYLRLTDEEAKKYKQHIF